MKIAVAGVGYVGLSLAVLLDINPRDSWRSSKAFRQHIAVEMARRALTESIEQAGGVIE